MNVGTLFAAVGLGVFSVTVPVVGVRLLCLARRTRQTPELLIGLAFVLCGVGYVLVTLPVLGPLASDSLRIALLTTGRFAFALGCGAAAVATWRVFRPAGFVSLALVYTISMMLGAGFVNDLLVPVPEEYRRARALYWMGFGAEGACFAWAAFESLRFARLMRRRLRFGLANAGVARRIRLWGGASGAVAASFVVAAAQRIWGDHGRDPEWLQIVIAALSLVAAVLIARAFFPRRRRKRLTRVPTRAAP